MKEPQFLPPIDEQKELTIIRWLFDGGIWVKFDDECEAIFVKSIVEYVRAKSDWVWHKQLREGPRE